MTFVIPKKNAPIDTMLKDSIQNWSFIKICYIIQPPPTRTPTKMPTKIPTKFPTRSPTNTPTFTCSDTPPRNDSNFCKNLFYQSNFQNSCLNNENICRETCNDCSMLSYFFNAIKQWRIF